MSATAHDIMLYDDSALEQELRDQLGIDNFEHEGQIKAENLHVPKPPDMTVVDSTAGPVKKPLSAWQDGFNYEDPPGKSWNEFFQETTFHGVKYIFEDSPFKYRKVTWGIVVVLAIALFTWQVGERINTYYKYQTTVDVEVIYTQTIDFPAVTICNQNSFRQTVAVDMELYHFIDELYESRNYTGVDFSKYDLDINAEDFAIKMAHQLEDFIDSCKWHSKSCDMSHDFIMTLTDLGVCYTFNGQKNPRKVTESGAGSGLSLVLNVEQYEYMRGPQNDAGVKILLHEHGEIPQMLDMGFAAAPGTHTLVGINRQEVISVPEPYGHCIAGGQPMSNCLTQCKTEYIMEMCQCRDVYMPDINVTEISAVDNSTIQVSYPVCDITQKFKCVEHNIEMLKQTESTCKCSVACERALFSPSLSYAHLSRFNVDRLVLTDPARKAKVNEQFLQAREVSQRTIVEVAEHDQELMTEILDLGKALKNILVVTNPKMEDFQSFARSHGYPNVIDGGMQSIQTDFGKLIQKMEELYEKMEEILEWLEETNRVQYNLGVLLDIQDNYSQRLKSLQACIPSDNAVTETSTEIMILESTPSNLAAHNPPIPDDSKEHDPTEGLSPECEELFIQVQKGLDCVTWRDERSSHEELQSLPDNYNTLITALYSNSSDSVPGHVTCMKSLQFLSSTYAPIAYEILKIAEEYSHEPKSINDLVHALELLYDISINSDFLYNSHWSFQYEESEIKYGCHFFEDVESGHITNCTWLMQMTSSYMRNFDKMYMAIYSGESISSQQAMTKASYAFNAASLATTNLYENINKKLNPTFEYIENYLKVNATKRSLAEHFDTVSVQEAITELASIKSRLDTGLQDFISNTKCMDQFIIESYKLFMETSVPVLHAGNIFDLNTYDDIKAMNGTYLKELQATSTDDFARVAAEILEETFEGYVVAASEIQSNITQILETLCLKMNILKKEMAAYENLGEMNDAFYMDNFLQVDIFYGTLSYQKVEQMPAFEISSLFGEIGGFLGLLLGASIITICELVDYITILIVKHCHKKKAVDPNFNNKKKPLF